MSMPTTTRFKVTPNTVKRAAARFLDVVGVNRAGHFIQKKLYGDFVRAVNYHAVAPEAAELFEQHLQFYARHFVSADVATLERFLETGEWPYEKPGLILSFDDGLVSHFEVAAPLLEKYGFTGWFFVPIGLVDLKGAKGTAARYMNGDQLKYLDGRHIVGSHTVNHVRLNKTRTTDELELEVAGSRKMLEEFLGHPVVSFCWVGGEEDTYSRPAADLVERNFRLGFMTNNAVITPSTCPLQLQRTNIEAEDPLWLVRFQLSGFMDVFYVGKRRRVNRLTAISEHSVLNHSAR